MTQFSASSVRRRRSKAEKEAWALRAIFDAMSAVGVTVTNVDEAYQAIDLAAKLLSYALGRKVKVAEVRVRMAELIGEDFAEAAAAEASATKH